MIPSRSTPNLRDASFSSNSNPTKPISNSVYAYLHNQSGLSFAPVNVKTTPNPLSRDEDSSSPPAPPVRDSSSLKSIKYGPGHEKFPSWPVPAAAETPQALRNQNSGGSHRSKSWTDHTNYPKEKVITYTRPFMKRQHSVYTQQKLKTVMERCEKIPPETFESRYDKMTRYLPNVDRDGKSIGDMDYMVPSPPERDIPTKPHLTQADLEEYARSYQEDLKPNHGLTESGLEQFMEYTRTYDDSLFSTISSKHDVLTHIHQKQISYAQSEGYHSYVSSTDSISTPFLDRLRRDSEAVTSTAWNEITADEANLRREGRDSVVTTSSGSASSSETLKWHGSMSDVSVASHSSSHFANSNSTRQLIAHSARVQTPQRHHSESVLYMSGEKDNGGAWRDRESRNNTTNKLKLFAVNTYTVQEEDSHGSGMNNASNNRLSLSLQSALSVAERISELEKQQKYSYLDPEKRRKVPDPTLKAIQKKALLSFYERHNRTAWRSEPQLAQQQQPTATSPAAPPSSPPVHKVQMPSRRASSASDYASGNTSRRSSLASSLEGKALARHQHSNSCGNFPTEVGPVIVGPSISVDDYMPDKPPARPPKNPHLRAAFPDLFQRVPSPDLPPPSPPTVLEDEVFNNDEPLPPPPPELDREWQQKEKPEGVRGAQVPAPQVQSSRMGGGLIEQTIGLPEKAVKQSTIRSSIRTKPTDQIFHHATSKPYAPIERCDQVLGFPNQKGYQERSSTRYPGTQKLVLNGQIAVSEKVNGVQYRPEPLRYKEDNHRVVQRASIAESPVKEKPPPLQPRQMRINHSMRVTRHGIMVREKVESRERSLSMSQSKASYLAPRRERDRIIPESETGSYKRTMSPNGHAIPENPDTQKTNQRETIWPIRDSQRKTNIIRRISMSEKKPEPPDEKEKPVVLPDVLPVNVKLFGNRPQQPSRPTHLSLSPLEKPICGTRNSPKSPPSSPPKISPRGSPFAPLKTTTISPHALPTSTGTTTTPTVMSTPSSRFSISTFTSPTTVRNCPAAIRNCPTTLPRTRKTSPAPRSPVRSSPQIKPSLSPNSSLKLNQKVPSTCATPLHPSPLSSPLASPKIPSLEDEDEPKRTELVSKTTMTIDAASQTEKEESNPMPLPTRKKLQEEIDCEKLAEDLLDHLPTSERLKELLVPAPEHKKPTDYVQGLFKVEIALKPRPLNSPFRSKSNTPSSSPPPTLTTVPINTISSSSSTISKLSSLSPATPPVPTTEHLSPLSGSSTYFTTSEPKAKLLNRYSKDMSQCHILKNTKDLYKKKEELVSRLDKKLEVLRSEQLVVDDECRLNDELGENVEVYINRVARPHEVSKFRLHVEEVGKITSLLLGLSGRLARAENALTGMAEDHPEKRILEAKRDKLLEQLKEAKNLKESIDKRSVSVSGILYKYLNSEEYADYDHFINMKAKLIMDSKEISDKIKLGEEQLMALKETLIITD